MSGGVRGWRGAAKCVRGRRRVDEGARGLRITWAGGGGRGDVEDGGGRFPLDTVAFQVVAVDFVHLLQVLLERCEVLERAFGFAAFPLANKSLLLGEVGEGGVTGEIHRGAGRDRRQVQGARGRRVRVRAEHTAMSACGWVTRRLSAPIGGLSEVYPFL